MSNIVAFRPRKQEEDAYLMHVVGRVATTTFSYGREDVFTKIALAMYDDDKTAFDLAVNELFSHREEIVNSVLERHGAYKHEAEVAGNEYNHTLRPPRGYEWVPIEKD